MKIEASGGYYLLVALKWLCLCCSAGRKSGNAAVDSEHGVMEAKETSP